MPRVLVGDASQAWVTWGPRLVRDEGRNQTIWIDCQACGRSPAVVAWVWHPARPLGLLGTLPPRARLALARYCPTCGADSVRLTRIELREQSKPRPARGPLFYCDGRCLNGKRSCDCRCRGECHGAGSCRGHAI